MKMNFLKAAPRLFIQQSCTRHFQQSAILNLRCSAILNLKDIEHREEDNKIIVEGKILDSPRKDKLLKCEQGGGKAACHPFCQSSIAGKVKHTDVLILDQFLDSRGAIHSQENLGICRRQWTRLRKMVEMAQRAGLMPGKEFYASHVRSTKWGSQNCYWDEKTIDIQWNRNSERGETKTFTKGLGK